MTVSYPGQRRTCGRCHQTSTECPGDELARVCEVNGGEKVDLRNHMENLWKKIGYKPHNTEERENEESEDEILDDIQVKEIQEERSKG